MQVRQQNQDSSPCGYKPTRNIRANRGSARVRRGEWHTIELYARLNTRNGQETCDGVLRVWVDGALTHDYSDVHYLDASTPPVEWGWARINYAAVWGGGPGTIPSRQSLFTAYIRASVR